MQMRIWRGLLLATLVLVASCGGDDEVAAPTTTDAPATSAVTTTTEAVDPFTVPDDPDDITEAYVEAVINEHTRVIGDALRIQLAGGDPQEVVDRYNAIYVPEVADALLTSIFAIDEEVRATIKQPPGNQVVEVLRILTSQQNCVEAEVLVDYSEVIYDAPAPTPDTVILRRASETTAYNMTYWTSEGVIPGTGTGTASC